MTWKSPREFILLCIFQTALNNIALTWNSHVISASRNAVAPNGRPLLMYMNPELFGGRECICTFSCEDLEVCKEECMFTNDRLCDNTIFELCCVLMIEINVQKTAEIADRKELYLTLRTDLLSIL